MKCTSVLSNVAVSPYSAQQVLFRVKTVNVGVTAGTEVTQSRYLLLTPII